VNILSTRVLKSIGIATVLFGGTISIASILNINDLGDSYILGGSLVAFVFGSLGLLCLWIIEKE